MKKITHMFLFIPIIAIMGCSTQHEFNKNVLYDNQPHLQFPPGLSGAKTQDLYPIPIIESESTEAVSLVPPGSQIGKK